MKILLIGGSGFIGGYLTKKVITREDCEAIIVYNNNLFLLEKSANVSYVKIDLVKPTKELGGLVNSVDIIVIMTQPSEKIIDNIIAAINSKSYLKKIIYFSTVLLYDNCISKQDECFPLNPVSDYEQGKFQEENKLSEFIKNNDLQLCIVRLSNVYGDIKNKGLIKLVFDSLLNGKPMVINGEGDSVRDYIFVEDVATWVDFLIFWNQKNQKEIYNVCTGIGYSVKEVVHAVENIVGKEVEKTYGPVIPEKKMIIGNNEKVAGLSGMNARYDFHEGLKKTYENYLATLSKGRK